MLRFMLNKYLSEEFGMVPGDMDIRFRLRGHKYRIPQFCPMWAILWTVVIIAVVLAVYIIVVGMIGIAPTIGG